MNKRLFLILSLVVLVSACGPSPEEQATLTATAQTATAAKWTKTLTSTFTFTPTYTSTSTFTKTLTRTATLTPTITDTPTITLTPTYDFPDVTVNVAMASCRYGPTVEHLHKYDLKQGDTGVVWGRAMVGTWLYVNMDGYGPCWLSPYVVDVVGDLSKMLPQAINLPITNALYAAPTDVEATRRGDEVIVTWEPVWMTEDDDRGYFLDVWVCQGGNLIWMPKSLPNQYYSTYSFIDEPGCSQSSSGLLYTVEKHGYTSPAVIPWPP